MNIFSGQFEIMVVSWLIDYGYGLLVDFEFQVQLLFLQVAS